MSSGLFGLVHTQYALDQRLVLTAAGIVMCRAVRKTGSLASPILAHVLWNSSVVPLAKMLG